MGLGQDLLLTDVSGHPLGRPAGIDQAVPLHPDIVSLAVFYAQVGGGTAVNFGAVLAVAGLTLLRLQISPVEGDDGIVEELGKGGHCSPRSFPATPSRPA